VAVSASENDVVSVWIHDVVRGTKSRLDAGSPYVEQPVWAPGGDRLAANVNWDIAVLDVEATRPPQTVAGGAVVQMEPSWSRDGRYIFFSVYDGKSDIWFREANGGSAAQKFLATPANERLARLAPDGRHLAYVSDESGRNEIYVREFPSGQKKQLVSVNGGFDPKWSPQGVVLVFVANDTLMAAPVERTPAFGTGVPKALFTAASIGAAWIDYDVATDARRFVVVRTLKAPERRAVVVENWPARVAGQAGRR
jgi:serine/threonine-protein kinase